MSGRDEDKFAAAKQVVASSDYGHPRWSRWLGRHPKVGQGLGVATVLFEAGVPLAIILPWPFAELLLGVALVFHLSTAAVMGLDSFVWAFSATYPAILWLRHAILGC